MNYKKTLSRIAELQKQRDEQIKAAEEQLNKTRQKLDQTITQLDKALMSVDAEIGTKMMEEKESLEKKITFLEESIKKRKDAPSIDIQEAEELKRSLNDELTRIMTEDRKKLENLLKDFKIIVENGTKAIDETQQNGQAINVLLKNGQEAYPVDGRITGFYRYLVRIIEDYEVRIRQSIETLIPKE